jgi:hypothetical protein
MAGHREANSSCAQSAERRARMRHGRVRASTAPSSYCLLNCAPCFLLFSALRLLSARSTALNHSNSRVSNIRSILSSSTDEAAGSHTTVQLQ